MLAFLEGSKIVLRCSHFGKLSRKPARGSAQPALAIILVCLLFSGCSSRARPLSLALGTLSVEPTARGLNELLTRLPSMPPDQGRQQLRAFCDSSAGPELKGKSAYVLGRMLQKSGTQADLKEAIDRFRQSCDLPPLWARAYWHMAECAQSAGDEKDTRDTLDTLSRAAKDKDAKLAATYALGQSYMRTGDLSKAHEQFSQVASLDPDSQFALGASYYLAEIDIADATGNMKNGPATASTEHDQTTSDTTTAAAKADGEKHNNSQLALNPPSGVLLVPEKALSAFRHYLDASPDGRFAAEIVSQLGKTTGFEPTVQDHNRFARVFYLQGDYARALAEWRKAGNTGEWFKQAVCLLRTGQVAAGKKALQAGMAGHPSDGAVVPAATTLARLLNRDGAIAVWKGVLTRSPRFADVAMYNLATRAPTNAIAVSYYRSIASGHPSSAYAPDAAWWCAWNDFKSGNSKLALVELQTAANRYPDSKAAQRCLYWIGKVHERSGQKQLAQADYITVVKLHGRSYYGHRAEARLAALAGHRDRGWSTMVNRKVKWCEDTSEEWSFPEPPQQLAHQEGATVEMLTELKQWDECLDVLKEKKGLLRAFYLAKMNLPLDAINAAYASLGNTPEPTEPWELAYPLLYTQLISKEAPQKKLDPFLVQALIREESRYNVQAVSHSQAIGLMQLMPGTAYGVAKRLGISLAGKEDIHKPENNLRLGIDYLSYVLGRFKGNALFAVASYNGGPNAVAHWASKWPGDADIFVEDIPFHETRDYVRKVFGSYWNYEAVYTKNSSGS